MTANSVKKNQWVWWTDPDQGLCSGIFQVIEVDVGGKEDAVRVLLAPWTDREVPGGLTTVYPAELTPLGKVINKHAQRLGKPAVNLLKTYFSADGGYRYTAKEVAAIFKMTLRQLRKGIELAVANLTWLARGAVTSKEALREMLEEELKRIGQTLRRVKIRVRLDPEAPALPQSLKPDTADIIGLTLNREGMLVFKIRHPDVAEIALDEILENEQ